MRSLRLFSASLVLWATAGLVDALQVSIPGTKGIQLKTAPLVGGPSWLPVHVKVVIEDKHVFDFVPLNPTSPGTLQKLVSLQAVPAEARCSRMMIIRDEEDRTPNHAQRGRDFCEHYTKDLHLATNNCWTFAFEIIAYMLLVQE
jgi:hypothetical protein